MSSEKWIKLTFGLQIEDRGEVTYRYRFIIVAELGKACSMLVLLPFRFFILKDEWNRCTSAAILYNCVKAMKPAIGDDKELFHWPSGPWPCSKLSLLIPDKNDAWQTFGILLDHLPVNPENTLPDTSRVLQIPSISTPSGSGSRISEQDSNGLWRMPTVPTFTSWEFIFGENIGRMSGRTGHQTIVIDGVTGTNVFDSLIVPRPTDVFLALYFQTRCV
ncbi:hypothetical protein N7478_007579 [Penicillium angulare]|uniref:uncharacterized protein n=1 Tax=Penicillium angulare TaxID=116970 RepID=UPI002540E5F9|nr:uncharacterized protein N7478_007579 [Penicillium angulare]KAJ5272454.1 hypothetical protein N7478_007579 [Penicillium angulare]